MLDSNELKPQQALEKILKLEIEIAENISAAKEDADKEISEAQDKTSELKNKIITDARSQRDSELKKGIVKAQTLAEKHIKNARVEAEKFIEVGRQFEDEAADHVLELVLKTYNNEEEK
jgi:vacuolar-type H+-ATPase subunit H